MLVVSRCRHSSRTLLARLKVDFEDIVEAGTISTYFASIERIGYVWLWRFH
jgi:hypothetical protein